MLAKLYEAQHAHFSKNAKAAAALLNNAGEPPDEGCDTAEWAAWTLVGNTLLNLDEVINKL